MPLLWRVKNRLKSSRSFGGVLVKKIDRKTAKHYFWKDVCDGWYLLDSNELSVIAEKMPPGSVEDMHFHRKARQFFYMLSGEAVMRFPEREEILSAGDGIEIEPNEIHQMKNDSSQAAEFIVVSIPRSHGDKIVIE